MLRRLHGGGVAVTFALSMWIGTIALGYAANAILPARTGGELAATMAHVHGTGGWVWLSLLALLLLWSLLRQGVRPFLERLFESPANLSGHHHDHAGHSHGGSCCAHEHDDGHAHAHAAPLAKAATGPSLGKIDLAQRAQASDATKPEKPDGGCCGH
jgi:ABC-type nickel/cobalt efflux system permease component RcnA